MMTNRKALLSRAATIGIAGVMGLAPASAQGRRAGGSTLTDQDRAEIQELVAHYARALGACAAEEYADLFAPGTGSFASSVRGEIAGREKLIALVQSERQCSTPRPAASTNASANANTNASNTARRPANGPTVAIELSPEGATGRASLGNAGHYDDVYVKTPGGWRFQSRDFVSGQEEAASFTGKDFIELRRLAGDGQGAFDDVYSDTPAGRRLRSSGVVIAPAPEGATGKAYLLKDGGHYEDVYVRTAAGWRFKSRTYVAPAANAESTQGSVAR